MYALCNMLCTNYYVIYSNELSALFDVIYVKKHAADYISMNDSSPNEGIAF